MSQAHIAREGHLNADRDRIKGKDNGILLGGSSSPRPQLSDVLIVNCLKSIVSTADEGESNMSMWLMSVLHFKHSLVILIQCLYNDVQSNSGYLHCNV